MYAKKLTREEAIKETPAPIGVEWFTRKGNLVKGTIDPSAWGQIPHRKCQYYFSGKGD